MTQFTILFEVTRSGCRCSSINNPQTEWIHIRINARNGLLWLLPRRIEIILKVKNIYFLFKSTLVLYALVFIQEHNIVSALSHTCEKHSQCISLYKCTLLMTDPLDVRVGWYHIWHCFNGPERLMRGACLNKSPLERISRFVEPPAQKPPLKAANMYQLFGWMARNSHLLAFLEHQNWERNGCTCASDRLVRRSRCSAVQHGVQVHVHICLSLSMLGEPYPLAS